MSKIINFCWLAVVVVSIIPLISCSPAAIAIKDPHYQKTQQMFLGTSGIRSVAYPDSPLFNSLCANNVNSDYPDPNDCTQFIKCYDEIVYLEQCPGGTIFNPFQDNFIMTTNVDACKKPYDWNDPAKVSCDALVGRTQPPLLFPTNPAESCGKGVVLCQTDPDLPDLTYECPEDCGYSKAFLGCLPLDDCKEQDKKFGLD